MAEHTRERLPPGQQWVAAGKWPYLGERAPLDTPAPWTVEVAGLVARPQRFTLDDLRQFPWVERTVDIHCVTRWSLPSAQFGGVRLTDVLAAAGVDERARFVSFVARTERNHSTSVPLDVLHSVDALLVLEYQGAPLSSNHGGPVRVVVPERYFYKSLKWLARIEVLEQDRLGYWEAMAGYHNEADPWREQRFMASQLSKQQMQKLLDTRDFAGRDLRGLYAVGHDLAGLDARGAVLRNADFSDAILQHARFDKVNLTLSRMRGADLRGASFNGADLEGVNFAGADLRGVDFRGASLVAATFSEPGRHALIDPTTQFEPARWEHLTPDQLTFLQQATQ